ncbi:non-ribosomal peptide synthetase [Roseomonas sp. CECT 9278]|uniref:non-ribosomal peptide synthetase n=1 Tax=Roseomonas sp. CECT 9278 TaxID=2845823 RepID=UPI001E3AE73E|nr:non-ribosomal peptide synthetase [Roseomonas sp. CECT 9278]CAH0301736.1 D-alanine--D-alanyl carrier protein ligase [Roseomonas sp. CECT 9278]
MDGQQPVAGIADLVSDLAARGISLRIEDGRLRYAAPQGALDEATRAVLRARREDILAFLARPAARPAEGLPASPAQKRLWFLERAGLAGHRYVTPVNLAIDGVLDVAALHRAIEALVHRHEALRTAFVERDGRPMQVVQPPAPFALAVTEVASEAALATLVEAEGRRPFDLTAPPLLRARLVRLAPDRHALLMAVHHIAFDGWSLTVLLEELGRLQGGQALAPLPLQMPDLAAAQAARHDAAGVQFWRAALEGLERTDLPTDRTGAPVSRGEGASTRFRLPGAAMALAREEGTTAFVLLLAAFLATLGREAGQARPAVGVPVANRTEPGSEGLIGFLVNTLVMRGDLRGDPSFRTLLRRMRAAWMAALPHQDVPFDHVVEAVQPARSLDATPLFSTMFAMQDSAAAAAAPQLPGLRARMMDHAALAARFDLEVHCWPEGDGFAGIAVHDVGALEAADTQRLLARWTALLEAAAAAPDAPLSALMAPSVADAACLDALNDTAGTQAPPLLHPLFETTALRLPDAPALQAGEATLTYRALDAASARIARALAAAGAGPETPVALCLDRGPWLHAAMLGILRAGAAVVPLDPDDAPARHAAILAAARPPLGIVEPRLTTRLPGVTLVDPATADGHDTPRAAPHPDSLAAIIFTSGSTGTPKGVEVPHRALANVARWHAQRLGDRGRRTLGFTHQAFDVFFQEAFSTWALGGTLVLLDGAARRDADRIAACIDDARIERVFMPFSPLSLVIDALAARGGGQSLTEIHTAGEAVRATPALAAFRAERPGLRLVNHYGPTEAYVVTTHEVAPQDDPVPIGRPLGDLAVRLLDHAGRSLPPGTVGEIAAAGWGLARGYRGDPAQTADRFRPDPDGPPGARLYRTGDQGRLGADGALRYLGRRDHQLKLRGFRVEPAEIERALLAGPELRAATVGLQDGRLVAHVVAAQPGADPLPALRDRLREVLPDHMRPAAIMLLPALPLLSNGKLDRAALPRPDAPVGDQPRSPIEEALAALFAETLGVAAIGIHDDFFAAGGHSLLATQLVSRIRAALGVELPLRRLFEAPTIAGIAAALDDGAAPPLPPRAGLAPADAAPLSFAQARLWLLDRLGLAGHAYTMPVALRLRGVLDVAALAGALAGLAARHEPLRTAFREIDGEPRQIVLPPPAPALDVIDATAAELPALQQAEVERPFDLSAGRPMRMRLLRLAADDHVLLGAIHHIAADGWSLQVIVRELGALYAHGTTGAALPLRYADVACWQRETMRGAREEASLAHWRARLPGVPALALPLDRPRPERESFNGASLPLHIPPALAARLAAFGRASGATPFMTLLAGFQALLHRLSGQARFAVGAPVANRNRGETEGLVGFFVNSLALDAECADDPDFATHLDRVKAACLGAFAHQDLPFERVVQDLAPGRDLSANPLFNTIFAVQAGETMAPRFDLPGLAVEVLAPPRMTVRFDMELHLWPQAQGFSGFLAYNRDLFDAATVAAWIEGYLALLEAAARAPATRLSALPLMRAAAIVAPLEGAPAARSDIPARFAAMAARDPDAPALVGDGFAISYGELDRRSAALAEAIARAGIGAEDVVALDLDRGAEAVIAMLATLRAGGAYLPIDPAMPAARREGVLAQARAALVIGPGLVVRDAGAMPRADAIAPDRLAAIMVTSGSTGTPKLVGVTHANIASRCIAPAFIEAGAQEVVLLHAPLAFDASTLEIWAPLLNGGAVAIAPPGRLSLADLAGFLDRHGVTRLWLTAGLFREMALAHPAALRGRRQVLAGGDVVAPDAVRAMLGHGAAFTNGYGPTETTIFALTQDVAEVTPGAIPVGRPVNGTTVQLLDAAGRAVPRGVPGEICVGGAGVARGYLGRPDLTAERFRPDPSAATPGARLYRTGDRGRIGSAGAVEFLGRIDRQAKIRGFRVEPAEIEAALLAQPGVAQAVVGTPAGPDGERRLVAWVVPAEGERDGTLRGWADLFDQRIYGAERAADAAFDTTGWISTYTGAPIPDAEMRDWVADTVEQVLARRPRAVLEPGCGTGLLLRRIAPATDSYCGTDASQVALDRIRADLDLPQVVLRRQDAADFTGIAPGSLDCVLLSSVVQYFPGLAYLREVIAGALHALRPGGVVHLADIRDLRHQRRLAAAAELARAPDTATAATLRAATDRRVAQEAELLIDPAAFATMDGVAAVELRLQPGPAHNELTRYRYTAVLHPTMPDWAAAPCVPTDDLDAVAARLARGEAFVATGLPNARLLADAAAQDALSAAAPATPAAALRAAATAWASHGVDPAAVLALARAQGWDCVLAPSADPDRFDAGFHRPGAPPPRMPAWQPAARLPDMLANTPSGSVAALVPALRSALEALLPPPMVPTGFVLLPRLPLTAIGKVDRAALPLPAPEAAAFAPPRDGAERTVAEAFAQALGLPRVGRDDDFFALGGHSLLAARIAATLRERLARDVPLRLFFEAPTVAALAARLEALDTTAPQAALSPDAAAQHIPFPLTDVQQAYWIGRDSSFAVGGTAAHVYFEVDAQGLDLDRFEAAWNVVVQRHGMLRAVVGADGTQRILAQVPRYAIARHDRPDGVRERLAEEMPPPDRWPLFRVEASRLADGWRLHVGIDTLVIDAHSLNLIFIELRDRYDGKAPPPPLALSFRDVVMARIAEQDRPAYAASRAYWTARLDTLPDAPALPLAPLRRDGPPRFALLSHRMDRGAWAQIRARAAARGLSPTSVVLAAFAETLAFWTREPDFTLNLTRFDRPPLHPEMTDLVGDFTALLLLAVQRSPGATFAEAAGRLQRRLWQDLEHPHPGAVALMREISRRRGRPPGMLFPVVFTSLLGLPGKEDGADALHRFGPVGFRAAQTPQVWLDHGVAEIGGELALTWNVLDQAFPDGVAEAMFGAYLRLLTNLAAGDAAWDRAVAPQLPAAQQAERRAMNATTVRREPTLLQAGLQRAAQRHAGQAAAIAGGRVLTHGELAARAHGLAQRLATMGIGRGSIVAVALRKGWEQAVATLAVLESGAAYLPVDPALPAERLRLLFADAGVRVVLTHAALVDRGWPDGSVALAVADAPLVAGAPGHGTTPEDLAYIIYTSGSTGRPKGVAMQHGATANTLADLEGRLALTPADRVLALSALSFDLSVWDLFGVPGAGGAAVIPVDGEERDPQAWARLAAEHRVTLWNSVPQLLQMRFDVADAAAPPPRAVLLSGDWIPLPLVDAARRRWPSSRLVSMGGATEAAIWSILHEIGAPDPSWSSVPYGRAMENQTIQVLAPDGAARPDWAEGEIHIGGIGLAQGYWGDAARTAAAFIRHPQTGDRLYRTGDAGRVRPGGVVEFLGRRDGQVKVNGFRIELGEVEAALASAPGVAQAAAAVTQDAAGGKALAGFVIAATGIATAPVLPADALPAAAEAALAAAPAEPADDAFHAAWQAEDARHARLVESALAAFGVFQGPEERWEAPALLARCAIAPRYAAWLDRGLARLAAAGALARSGPAWVARRPLLADDAGAELAAILTERVHSAQLYADPAIPALYERIFGGCHRALAGAFAAVLARLPAGRPLRVLEVGAGYGTATRHLLPLLPPGATYRFTDISRFFLDQAERDFAATPGLETALLDLDRPAATQGVAPGSVDIIVAASVLHDASRIAPTLQDLAVSLAPGGVLLAIEETTFHAVYDLGMGLQQGFDRMTDRELRPDHPLLSRAGWRAAFAQAGFAESRCIARPGSIPDALGLDVLIAQAGTTARGPSPDAVLDHARAVLPEHMVPRSVTVLPALPLSPNGKLDRAALAALAPSRAAAPGLAPRTPLEGELLGIWSRLLALDTLGVECDLFAHGADSLVATRAVSLMREATGVELPLRTIFEQPSVAALAAAVQARRWVADDAADDGEAELL